MDIDDFYSEYGDLGPWQMKLAVALLLPQAFLGFQQVHNLFSGAEPKFYCKIADQKSVLGCPVNGTCTGYTFTGDDFTSIVSEYDLVCENSYKANLIQSGVMAGILVGVIVFGAIADNYGRKITNCITLTGMSIFSLCGLLPFGLYYYMLMRFFVGVCCGGFALVSFNTMSEIVGKGKRSMCSLSCMIFFPLGIALLALLAYFIRDWKALTVVTSLPGFVGIYYWWIFPESPRWLLSQGKKEKAERVLEYFVYKNTGAMPKVPIVLKDVGLQASSKHTVQKDSFLTLFTNKILRVRTGLNCYLWFVNCAAYYGLTMASGNLGGNMYLGVALSGLIEIPAVLVCTYIIDKFGRRPSFSATMLIGGAACLTVFMLPNDGVAKTAFSLTGKGFISISFSIAWIYAAELYPTSIRNQAMSLCSGSARVGGIVSPMLIQLSHTYPNIDFITLGITVFIGGFLCLQLPETLNQPMAETVDDLLYNTGSRGQKPEVTMRPIPEDKLKLLQSQIEENENDGTEDEMLP